MRGCVALWAVACGCSVERAHARCQLARGAGLPGSGKCWVTSSIGRASGTLGIVPAPALGRRPARGRRASGRGDRCGPRITMSMRRTR